MAAPPSSGPTSTRWRPLLRRVQLRSTIVSATALVDRDPVIGPDELITGLVPPPRFDAARFQTYRPNPAEPSQQAAVTALTGFAQRITTPPRKGLFRRSTPAAGGY